MKEKYNILCVEDNDYDFIILNDNLEHEGSPKLEVFRATTLSDSFEILKKESIHIALLDLNLPDKTGIGTLVKLVENAPLLPIVVFTGLNDESIGIESIKSGAQDYLVKGQINSKQLLKTIYYAIERKKILDELQNLKDDLLLSNKELQEFAYVASHDLQEPLRMVTSYMQLLEKKYKDKIDDKASEYIYFAVDGAKRMGKLINDLLEYSRVGTRGKEFTTINCNDVLKLVLQYLDKKIQESKAKINYANLPVIFGDETQICQLFQNLIGNSLKYCKDRNPEINISVEEKNNTFVFSINDNGIGIPLEHLDRIFQIFQRLHTRDEYEGTGIGLSICKKIVERHGGKIWVESKEGQGSTFYFSIPKL